MTLEAGQGRCEADRDQEELQGGVDLGDGSRLDSGRGQGGIKVLLEAEGRHDAHVTDVEAGIDEEQVPRHDQPGQRGRDEVGVGQSKEHSSWINTISAAGKLQLILDYCHLTYKDFV